jgi:hypothetical protein
VEVDDHWHVLLTRGSEIGVGVCRWLHGGRVVEGVRVEGPYIVLA